LPDTGVAQPRRFDIQIMSLQIRGSWIMATDHSAA
jgi:hypothetical protein